MRVPSLFLRRIDRQRGIDTHRVREVTIRSREAMLFHVDGEAVQGPRHAGRARASRRAGAARVEGVSEGPLYAYWISSIACEARRVALVDCRECGRGLDFTMKPRVAAPAMAANGLLQPPRRVP